MKKHMKRSVLALTPQTARSAHVGNRGSDAAGTAIEADVVDVDVLREAERELNEGPSFERDEGRVLTWVYDPDPDVEFSAIEYSASASSFSSSSSS